MRATSRRMKSMGQAYTNGQMERFMRVSGETTRCMAKAI
jgi:hypothetical protein